MSEGRRLIRLVGFDSDPGADDPHGTPQLSDQRGFAPDLRIAWRRQLGTVLVTADTKLAKTFPDMVRRLA